MSHLAHCRLRHGGVLIFIYLNNNKDHSTHVSVDKSVEPGWRKRFEKSKPGRQKR